MFFLVTCCGFVTFTNPRSAIDAINDMNGRTIDGLVVKVSEVTTRNGRSNFGCDSFRLIQNEDMIGREARYVSLLQNLFLLSCECYEFMVSLFGKDVR